ncbi:hypothetical protein D9M70_591640 [compost metagenome]
MHSLASINKRLCLFVEELPIGKLCQRVVKRHVMNDRLSLSLLGPYAEILDAIGKVLR